MKPINMLTLFFRAVGFLVQLRGVFYFGYFLVALHLTEHSDFSGHLTDCVMPLYQALGSSVAGGLMVLWSPGLARFVLWGFKEQSA